MNLAFYRLKIISCMGSDNFKKCEKFEDVPGYENLPPPPKDVIFPYGIKVVEIDGKKMWQAASEQDYRNTVSEVSGIKPEDVDVLAAKCALSFNHMGNPICTINNGYCPGGCVPVMNTRHRWFCNCMG